MQSTLIGPVFCSCGPLMVCGGVTFGCNACSFAASQGVSCGTRCSATPVRLRNRKCWSCSAPLDGRVTPIGYCSRCVAMVMAPLN